MLNGLLPIGSVVLLNGGEKRVMIIGFCQAQEQAPEILWDYVGCLYPEGFLDAEKNLMFNNEQIDKVFAVGYQDEEQFSFKVKLDSIYEQLRTKHPIQPSQGSQTE